MGVGWASLLTASMLVVLAACTSDVSVDRSATTSPATPTPTETLSSQDPTHPFEFGTKEFRLAPQEIPYPYTTPTPPPEPTRLDGTYMRILTLEDVHGLLPFRCLRCPPYLPNAGVSTLALHRGNYWLHHQLSGFKALGMFTIEGHRITFFNDPWCPRDRGTYRWNYAGDRLTKAGWTRIQPCIYRIENLWPGPVAC
jgi:hypothetical protein